MQTTYFLRESDAELAIEFDASFTPAKLSGAWENCYPEDSQMDITSITWNGIEVIITDQDELDLIEQACWDAYFDECRNLKDEYEGDRAAADYAWKDFDHA